MNRKILIKYLESILYPINTYMEDVTFQDEENTFISVNLKELQQEFEKMLSELRR